MFQQFDRLLFLAKGGKTVYFGDIGKNSETLLHYFEVNGARKCGYDENPAEYMLEVVNNGTNEKGESWSTVWSHSTGAQDVQAELDRIHTEKLKDNHDDSKNHGTNSHEFAMPFATQLYVVTYRVLQQYWRMPSYIFSKFMLATFAGLFIGFSFFDASATEAGTQNVIFSVFMITTIFTTLVQQVSFLMKTYVSRSNYPNF